MELAAQRMETERTYWQARLERVREANRGRPVPRMTARGIVTLFEQMEAAGARNPEQEQRDIAYDARRVGGFGAMDAGRDLAKAAAVRSQLKAAVLMFEILGADPDGREAERLFRTWRCVAFLCAAIIREDDPDRPYTWREFQNGLLPIFRYFCGPDSADGPLMGPER